MTEHNQVSYPSRAVVDTCVIVNVALGEKDTLPPEYLSRSKKLLDDGMRGELKLLIPSMALIELCSEHEVSSNRSGVPREEMRRRKNLLLDWCERCDLPTVDLTVDAAEWFRHSSGVQKLRPGDAAILASAYYAHAEVVYTWDERFIKTVMAANKNTPLGVKACNPPSLPEPEFDLFNAMSQ